MKKRIFLLGALFAFSLVSNAQIADKKTYLAGIVAEMHKKWPDNRTINIVFHGHSVPTGYFSGQEVHTFESYPHYMHYSLKELYKYSVINCIRTSIGGETARKGSQRFNDAVLPLKPDLLFIDYSLNDRALSLEEARICWESMITTALDNNIKVILCTPTPDTTEDITDEEAPLNLHAEQVRGLAEEYHVGLVDSYELFKQKALAGEDIGKYMSQNNHPNAAGHKLVADEIMKWFTSLSVETDSDFVDSEIDFEGSVGASAVFDYNGDGINDIIYSDGSKCCVYLNNGEGGFSKVDNHVFPALEASTILYVDIDNDNVKELFMSGLKNGVGLCKMYKWNDSMWKEITDHGLPSVYSHSNASMQNNTSFVVSDFNKDGYVDFAVNGLVKDQNSIAGVYLNNKNNTFTSMSTDMTSGSGGGILASDLDNDGYDDLVLWGYEFVSNSGYLEVYKNVEGNAFEKQSGSLAPQTWSAQVVASDFNGDGYKDLLLLSWATKLFLNNGEMDFKSEGNKGLPNVTRCYGIVEDNGTYPDVIIAALIGNLSETSLYKYNTTLGLYEKNLLSGIGEYGSLIYEDFDNNGSKDIFVTGKNRESQPDAALLYAGNHSSLEDASVKDYNVVVDKASKHIYINSSESEDIVVVLWNSTGQLCLEKDIITNSKALNYSSLPSGLYILSIDNGSNRESYKVLL